MMQKISGQQENVTPLHTHSLQTPVIREPEKIPIEIFTELLRDSKCMGRLLSQGSPLAPTPLAAIVNPVSDYAGNYDLPSAGCVRKRLLPRELFDSALPEPISLETFAAEYLAGAFPAQAFFKPDGSAGGNGVMKLVRDAEAVSLVMRNPESRSHLPSQQLLLDAARCDSRVAVANCSATTCRVEVPRTTPDAAGALAEMCRLALTTVFPHESAKRFGYTDVNSGLVEPALNFLKIGGQIVEGRYYVLFSGGELLLSRGMRMDGKWVPSYLKVGIDGQFVNAGEIFAEWPQMHEPIAAALGLNCSGADFNAFMQAQLFAHAKRVLQNMANLCDNPEQVLESIEGAGFIIDAAWPKPGSLPGEQPANPLPHGIPQPVLIETSLRLKFRDGAREETE